mmetsp:Transcript_14878/g.41823  ORF Transcript_14878/g.41823 Transcript_14878/m.41823 type:complete len:184 (+) Transcript_14878:54-605(+)
MHPGSETQPLPASLVPSSSARIGTPCTPLARTTCRRKSTARPRALHARTEANMPKPRSEEHGGPTKQHRMPTAFESRLYQVCQCIPAGKVTTYGALAAVLKSSPRAAGQALRRNPFAPTVPCHRVIAATGALGGFFGCQNTASKMVQKKRWLLESEGVALHGDKVDGSCILSAAELASALASG